jgi:hypothetical protein
MKAFRSFARHVAFLRVFLGVGALALAGRGSALAADNTIAVLGIEATDGAPESVAALVTDALRQRATAEKGMKLVPGKDLVDIKLIFSCPDEAPTCMADAARSLGVSRLIFGSVKRAPGDSYVMTLKMLDVGRRQVVAFLGEPLSRALATPGAIRGPVEKWFATLTGQSTTGTVRVRGDIPGISVALDGAPMGVLGTQELVLTNVPAGRREIVASKPGYAPVRKEVTVVAGGTVDVALELASGDTSRVSSGGGYPRSSGTQDLGRTGSGADGTLSTSLGREDNRDGLKWGSWATAAASVASFGLAIKFALDVDYYNKRLDPFRRFPCVPPAMGLCDKNNQPAMDLTTDQQQFVTEESKDGKDFQTYEFIALGVGGALAIASGVLFYFGYFAEDGGAVPLGPRADAPKLRVSPFLSGDSGGITSRITF